MTLLIAILQGSSCKKSETVELVPSSQNIENFDKLFRFVSVITAIPQSELKFDHERMGFYLPGTSFYMSLEEVQRYYEKANVYKSQYEK